MKPSIMVKNRDLFHGLGILKQFNLVSIDNNKQNNCSIKKILKNINRNKINIIVRKEKDKLILEKKNSSFDYYLYLK